MIGYMLDHSYSPGDYQQDLVYKVLIFASIKHMRTWINSHNKKT